MNFILTIYMHPSYSDHCILRIPKIHKKMAGGISHSLPWNCGIHFHIISITQILLKLLKFHKLKPWRLAFSRNTFTSTYFQLCPYLLCWQFSHWCLKTLIVCKPACVFGRISSYIQKHIITYVCNSTVYL